jgi:hypothetical protein
MSPEETTKTEQDSPVPKKKRASKKKAAEKAAPSQAAVGPVPPPLSGGKIRVSDVFTVHEWVLEQARKGSTTLVQYVSFIDTLPPETPVHVIVGENRKENLRAKHVTSVWAWLENNPQAQADLGAYLAFLATIPPATVLGVGE